MNGSAPTSAENAFLSLGSNIEPERYIPQAAGQLTSLGRVVAWSNVYQSRATGAAGSPDFLNAAVLIRTSLAPRELRAKLRAIESALGRLRLPDRNAPRTIDLDLCLYGDAIVDDGEVVVPDRDILTRPYLAQTLAELDGSHPYPGRRETLGDIASILARGAELQPRPDVTESLRRIIEGGRAADRGSGRSH